jgi:hypothetical protein
MSVKINSLEFENVKRIKAVQLTPAKNGLTVIGGDNRQGKTSVLDAIAWALGGDRFKPSKPQREGSVIEPHLKVTLDNGIVVERSGKNSSLKVIDPSGNKGGQQLLNSFVEQLALDLPKFLNQSSKEKADTLLKIIGVGEQLYKLEQEEQLQYNRRTEIGRIADQKAKFAKEMPVYTDVPAEPLSVSELIQQQQEILAHNGANKMKRDQLSHYEKEYELAKQAFDHAKSVLDAAENNLKLAKLDAKDLEDKSTAELEANIQHIEDINKKVRANLDRQKAEIEAEDFRSQYDELTEQVEAIRQQKRDLLKGADLPLEGLTVEGGELVYNGQKWDCMSGAEQLIVATSIVRKLNPDCGFVLLDKLEQLDSKTLDAFGNWLEKEGLQAIATRVSSGDECAIIIEDGISVTTKTEKKEWKAGAF